MLLKFSVLTDNTFSTLRPHYICPSNAGMFRRKELSFCYGLFSRTCFSPIFQLNEGSSHLVTLINITILVSSTHCFSSYTTFELIVDFLSSRCRLINSFFLRWRKSDQSIILPTTIGSLLLEGAWWSFSFGDFGSSVPPSPNSYGTFR